MIQRLHRGLDQSAAIVLMWLLGGEDFASIVGDEKAKSRVVEAPGIEPPATYVRNVANGRESDADLATQDDSRRREVSASTPMSPDEAIRLAAKVAIDAGDLTRARRLLDLLDVERHAAPVAILAPRKSPR